MEKINQNFLSYQKQKVDIYVNLIEFSLLWLCLLESLTSFAENNTYSPNYWLMQENITQIKKMSNMLTLAIEEKLDEKKAPVECVNMTIAIAKICPS